MSLISTLTSRKIRTGKPTILSLQEPSTLSRRIRQTLPRAASFESIEYHHCVKSINSKPIRVLCVTYRPLWPAVTGGRVRMTRLLEGTIGATRQTVVAVTSMVGDGSAIHGEAPQEIQLHAFSNCSRPGLLNARFSHAA